MGGERIRLSLDTCAARANLLFAGEDQGTEFLFPHHSYVGVQTRISSWFFLFALKSGEVVAAAYTHADAAGAPRGAV